MMNLLFICTHNRCRSILAEAITNHLARGHLHAYSAGSQPAGVIHPGTLKALQRRHYPTIGLQSQSWDQFSQYPPRVVITLCDEAAQESCPLWLSEGIKVHWSFPDPSRVKGTEAEVQSAFDQVIDTLEERIHQLLTISLDHMNDEALSAAFKVVAQKETRHELI